MINFGDVIDGRYRIIEKIGSGGMADVFEANDFIANRNVAIKIMKEELLHDSLQKKFFEDEIYLTASMSHQNIVKVFNEGIYKNCPYLVIEYFKEQTLLNKLEYLTKFSLKEAVQIMIQLLDALNYTHEHGFIHRDIKPQNIFYLSNGTIKLGDFGIAINSIDAKASNASIFGSIHYLAPEVLNGFPFSVRSDVYACGITFFQLLTGRLPFEDGQTVDIAEDIKNKDMPKPSKFDSSIPKDIDNIILKATNKNPGDRFMSCIEFQTALLDFQNGKKFKENFFTKIIKKL